MSFIPSPDPKPAQLTPAAGWLLPTRGVVCVCHSHAFPAVRFHMCPRCPAAREAGMRLPRLFLSSPVPTALFSGSEFLPGSQGWGWMSQSLGASRLPCPNSTSSKQSLRAETPSRRVGRRNPCWEEGGERHLAHLEGRLCILWKSGFEKLNPAYLLPVCRSEGRSQGRILARRPGGTPGCLLSIQGRR